MALCCCRVNPTSLLWHQNPPISQYTATPEMTSLPPAGLLRAFYPTVMSIPQTRPVWGAAFCSIPAPNPLFLKDGWAALPGLVYPLNMSLLHTTSMFQPHQTTPRSLVISSKSRLSFGTHKFPLPVSQPLTPQFSATSTSPERLQFQPPWRLPWVQAGPT